MALKAAAVSSVPALCGCSQCLYTDRALSSMTALGGSSKLSRRSFDSIHRKLRLSPSENSRSTELLSSTEDWISDTPNETGEVKAAYRGSAFRTRSLTF